MRYVQFQVSPVVSDLLTSRAEQDDLVLGEVVMDALHAFDPRPTPAPSRRRRRSSTSVRRQVLVRPAEADEIKAMAERYGYTPSALIRATLENYLR